MHTLHAQVAQLAARSRVDGGELRGGVGASGLSLPAADAGGGLWRWLVLGLLLLVALLLVVARCSWRTARPAEAGLVLTLSGLLVMCAVMANASFRVLTMAARAGVCVVGRLPKY